MGCDHREDLVGELALSIRPFIVVAADVGFQMVNTALNRGEL